VYIPSSKKISKFPSKSDVVPFPVSLTRILAKGTGSWKSASVIVPLTIPPCE